MRSILTLQRKASRLALGAAVIAAGLLLPPGPPVDGAERPDAAVSPGVAKQIGLPTHLSLRNHFVIVNQSVREQMDERDYSYLDHIYENWSDSAQNGSRPLVTDIMSGEQRVFDTRQKFQHRLDGHFDIVQIQETLSSDGLHVTLSYWSFWPERMPNTHLGKGEIPLGPFDVRGEGLDGARSDAVDDIVGVLKGLDAHHRGQQVAGLQGGR
jgi:hypothetical protein